MKNESSNAKFANFHTCELSGVIRNGELEIVPQEVAEQDA